MAVELTSGPLIALPRSTIPRAASPHSYYKGVLGFRADLQISISTTWPCHRRLRRQAYVEGALMTTAYVLLGLEIQLATC